MKGQQWQAAATTLFGPINRASGSLNYPNEREMNPFELASALTCGTCLRVLPILDDLANFR